MNIKVSCCNQCPALDVTPLIGAIAGETKIDGGAYGCQFTQKRIDKADLRDFPAHCPLLRGNVSISRS